MCALRLSRAEQAGPDSQRRSYSRGDCVRHPPCARKAG
jgi:hypothetical protein